MSAQCSLTAEEIWPIYVRITHDYAAAVDEGRATEVAELFADEGVWDGSAFRLPVLHGRDAIARHFAAAVGAPEMLHLNHNHRIREMSDQQVVAESVTHSIQRSEDQTRHILVRYTDTLVCDNGRWCLARRVLGRGPRY
jgi:ketosteroid isomerase-like protein